MEKRLKWTEKDGIQMKKGLKQMKERKGFCGSYTVEAAAVVSLTFLVLGALIIAVFFAHDRAVAQGMVCEAAVEGSNFMTSEERTEAAAKVRESISQERFLGSRSISASTGVGEKTSSASCNASFPVPGLFMKFLSGGSLDLHCTWSSEFLDPTDVIWKIRGAEMVLENFSGE